MNQSTEVAKGRSTRPDLTDLYVGMRLSLRRKILGLQKDELAMAAGISVDQLRSFEAGLERISAARLYKFSQYLDVPVSWFFDGLGPEAEAMFGGGDVSPTSATESIRRKDSFELLRFYYDSIIDPQRRRALVEVARVLAESDAQPDVEPANQ